MRDTFGVGFGLDAVNSVQKKVLNRWEAITKEALMISTLGSEVCSKTAAMACIMRDRHRSFPCATGLYNDDSLRTMTPCWIFHIV